MGKRVLLTGATGFVGAHLYPALAREHGVRCASRDPRRAASRHPDREWVALDVHDDAQLASALEGVDVVYYLVHAMAEGEGYKARERDAANRLVRAARAAGVERVIYLGGVEPEGKPSEHLASRLETGRLLRAGSVPVIELRAGMIIGAGSASWRICRDLAARLPFMLLPKWLETRSQPVAIDDVVAALAAAADVELEGSAIYDLPGPETLKAVDILIRIARLMGTEPLTIRVPVLTPKLSSYWLKLVTGADFSIARELVEGLTSDLVATHPAFWDRMPGHTVRGLDEAARAALGAEDPGSLRAQLLEAAARRLSRRRSAR